MPDPIESAGGGKAMLCVIHVKHDSEDKQTGYWQFECSSCMRNKIAALRAENERLHEQVSSHAGWLWCCREDLKCAEKRIAELIDEVNEALPYVMGNTAENELVGWRKRHVDAAREALARAAAALKEDAEWEAKK